MFTEQIKSLNYCADAIESLKIMERDTMSTAPYTSYAIRNVIDMLEKSVKFILPNCCDIIAPEYLRQAHLDMAHIPYPVVTFEIPWKKETPLERMGEFPSSLSTKRIALCWELNPDFEPIPGCNDISHLYPSGGVFILPISWSDNMKMWVIGVGGVFFPYENQLRNSDLDNLQPASKIAFDALKEAGLYEKKGMEFRAEPFIACKEWADDVMRQLGSREKLFAQIILDSRDELQAYIQACSVLNCENVKTITLNNKPAAGKKLKNQNNQPRFTYKVLQLSDDKKSYETNRKGATGTHASPRMHLRRGHMRRRNEKLIWVRPTMINAGSEQGIVTKDYQIKTT